MKYDLFISDFDGTLGHGFNGIDEETVSAIKKFVDKKGKFVVITGRTFDIISFLYKKHGIEGLVGCLQGADIRDLKTAKSLFTKGLCYKDASQIVKVLSEEKKEFICCYKDHFYYENDSLYAKMYIDLNAVPITKVKSVQKIIEEKKQDVCKIDVFYKDRNSFEYLKKYREIFPKTLVTCPDGGLIEFVNPNCTKNFAVKYIADYYGIPLEKVITVGDSKNDLTLIKGVWHGVAVGDADEELKQNAKEITLPYSEKPVKYLLEKYCLKD